MFRRISRTLALLLAAMAAVFLSVTPASAGEEPDYPTQDCTITATPPNPTADTDVTITGENWPAGATVHVTVGGEAAGTTTASDAGTWSIIYHVPADAVGPQAVSADGCAGDVLGTTITAGALPAALPITGSSSTEPLVRTGAVLIAAGAVLVYAVRRRNQAAAS